MLVGGVRVLAFVAAVAPVVVVVVVVAVVVVAAAFVSTCFKFINDPSPKKRETRTHAALLTSLNQTLNKLLTPTTT